MPTNRPRPQVSNLQGNAQILPAADPRTADTYIRPGAQEVMRPPASNPMLKLAESLSELNTELKPVFTKVAQQYTEEEEAKLVQDFQANREKWNTAVRNGEVPLGASPHAARAVKRLMLSELADDFHSWTALAFNGEAGAAARESNDPRVMRQFLEDQRTKFYQEHLRNGDRELYHPLDVQETFAPKIEKAASELLRTHANYRIQETERELVDTVGASVSRTIEDTFKGFSPMTPDDERRAKMQEAAAKIAATLYDPDHGAVKNGLHPKKGGDVLVDSITSRAMALGDRSVLEIIDHIQRPRGEVRLADVPAVQQKRLQAEEHITQIQVQQERHRWALEDRPHEVAAKLRQEGEWQKQDERWAREQASWQQQDAGRADHEILRSLTRRVYEGLRRDSKQGVAIINEAIRSAETVLPEKAEQLRGLVHEFTKNRADYPEDDLAIARLRAKISIDPLSVHPSDITAMVKNKEAKRTTAMGLYDDLDRAVGHADHPFLRQTEFTEMLHQIQRGSMQSPEDEFSAQGQLRVANATASFRDRAQDWLATHPQGNIAAFREYMRAQVAPVIELANREYGLQQETERKKQTDKGQMVVGKTQQAVADRESKQQAAAELERRKQERETQLKSQRDLFNSNFRPSGKKTSEGREILVSPTGAIATEQTITIHGVPEINNGGITNIPTIFNGKKYSDEEAIDIVARAKGKDPDTGKPLKRYYSIKDAEIAARERSNRLGQEYQSKTAKTPATTAAK